MEDGAWMLWENSYSVVAVVVAHPGLGRETRDERREKRDERRETRDERREKREERSTARSLFVRLSPENIAQSGHALALEHVQHTLSTWATTVHLPVECRGPFRRLFVATVILLIW